MKIHVAELRNQALRLLRHLEETYQEELELDADYYWEIDCHELYDPFKDPGRPTLGQLSDDWQELQATMRDEDEHPPTGYSLVQLASILRAIGHQYGR